MGDLLEKLREHLSKPEVQEAIKKEQEKEKFLDSIKEERLLWFNSIGSEKRAHYIEKIINKYNSKKYKDRWYNRGIFPPEELYWFIYDYAYKYGKCWIALSEEVGPGFTHKFVFDNWKVILYNGQGSIVRIDKVTDKDLQRGPDEWGQKWLGHEYDRDYYETLTKEFE